MPVPQVYLDSSDFSVLSDLRRADPSLHAVRESLLKIARSGKAQFRFSMVHVCEAAPIDFESNLAAARRADLIHQLCGSNSLAPINEIIAAELVRNTSFSPLTNGRWYPSLDDLLPANPVAQLREMATSQLAKMKGSQKHKNRLLASIFTPHGQLTANGRASLAMHLPNVMAEMLKVFPLTDAEARALKSYLSGGLGRDVATAACERVLEDPRWLMERIASDPMSLSGVIEWLRGGGVDFVARFKPAIETAQRILQDRLERTSRQALALGSIDDISRRKELEGIYASSEKELDSAIARSRRELEESVLRGVARGPESASLDELRASCPGLSAAVAAAVHAVQRAMQDSGSRQIKPSDFGDAMHAFYAPYVDIYRTDAFMSDAVEKALWHRDTVVARKLSDVPRLIAEFEIRRRAPS